MAKRAEWDQIKELGSGGQSDVFLVRTPNRTAERANDLKELKRLSGLNLSDDLVTARFAECSWNVARPERPTELGALKVYKTRDHGLEAEQQAFDRLKSEIRVLRQKRYGLITLLDSNEDERWIVTEYLPNGTLEDHPFHFKGNVPLALKAFRSLVRAAAALHSDGIVHRDIKPANVFIGNEHHLVLGDLGIVFFRGQAERVTVTDERVGPRDYMPQWADLGERLEKVGASFDVYMLGKLLWCMISGKLKLPREYHRRAQYDLAQTFPDDPNMHIVNRILDKCIVEEADQCLQGAQDLLLMVDAFIKVIGNGGQLLSDKFPRVCRVCGFGHYRRRLWQGNRPMGSLRMWLSGDGSDLDSFPVGTFVCDNPECGHVEFFVSS